MENIVDLIATDSKASEVSDQIKNILFTKAAEKVESQRTQISASIFAEPEETQEEE